MILVMWQCLRNYLLFFFWLFRYQIIHPIRYHAKGNGKTEEKIIFVGFLFVESQNLQNYNIACCLYFNRHLKLPSQMEIISTYHFLFAAHGLIMYSSLLLVRIRSTFSASGLLAKILAPHSLEAQLTFFPFCFLGAGAPFSITSTKTGELILNTFYC